MNIRSLSTLTKRKQWFIYNASEHQRFDSRDHDDSEKCCFSSQEASVKIRNSSQQRFVIFDDFTKRQSVFLDNSSRKSLLIYNFLIIQNFIDRGIEMISMSIHLFVCIVDITNYILKVSYRSCAIWMRNTFFCCSTSEQKIVSQRRHNLWCLTNVSSRILQNRSHNPMTKSKSQVDEIIRKPCWNDNWNNFQSTFILLWEVNFFMKHIRIYALILFSVTCYLNVYRPNVLWNEKGLRSIVFFSSWFTWYFHSSWFA